MQRREFLKASLGGAAWAAAAASGLAGCAAAPRAPDPEALAELDGVGLAERVAEREVTPAELVQAAMRRISALEPELNAVVTKSFDRALARLVEQSPTGPFAGVPYLLKDLTPWQGERCTFGSRLFLDHVAERSPPLVEASEAAGLVVLGKTNTPEFGLLPSTEGLALGPCRSPWDLTRSTGGSSGGAAAAVAAGIVPLAEASDGGGSIRIPASCCGVFGLKPSRGRHVDGGDAPGPWDIAVHHCVSRSVRDSALLLAVTERRDGGELPPVGLVEGPAKRRLRIAWSTQSPRGEEPDPEVKAATEAAVTLCASLGHELVPRAPAVPGEPFVEHFLALWAHGPAELVESLAERGVDAERVLEPWTLGLAADYVRKPLGTLPAALQFFAEVERTLDAFFAEFDVWLTPVLASPPPPLGTFAPDVPFATLRERCIRWVAYTPVHNVAGTPAMSVPLGWSVAGLPIGVQFAARRGAEATLLALAYELEATAPWAGRRPAPHLPPPAPAVGG